MWAVRVLPQRFSEEFLGLIDISQCPLNIHNVRGYFRIREHLKRAFQVREGFLVMPCLLYTSPSPRD